MSVKAILHGLNARQRQAVETTKGPCLVLAGPGSGKTRVLTSRIAYLLEQGVAPEQILAITFTKKAAAEMNDRVRELLGGVPRGLTIRTFHSLGYCILRENARLAGISVPFQIATEAEQLDVLKPLVDDLDEDDPYIEAKDLLRGISLVKNHGLSVDAFRRSAGNDADQFLAEVYERYDAALREQNAVDLDDLILRALRDVLEADENVARAYQRRFRYITIDEYQDTNGPQYELTKALLSAKRNLCVVGDDDQSIYGFRGANVNHILKFADDFPGTRVIKFETNYRSSDQIVSLASRVIERARSRYPKRIESYVGRRFPVELTTTDTCNDEADQIRDRIRELIDSSEASYNDIALLYRRHEDTKTMKLHLQAAGIPCRGSGTSKPGVSILTLHAAKGLEFPVVFLPSLEDKTVPHFHAIGEGPDAIEEERRLFYVGLTRAKSRLYLSSSSSRFGKPREQSRFLTELGDAGGCLRRFARQGQAERNKPAFVA